MSRTVSRYAVTATGTSPSSRCPSWGVSMLRGTFLASGWCSPLVDRRERARALGALLLDGARQARHIRLALRPLDEWTVAVGAKCIMFGDDTLPPAVIRHFGRGKNDGLPPGPLASRGPVRRSRARVDGRSCPRRRMQSGHWP